MREPAKASATSAGTWAFIAQVRSSLPVAPNLRPAMKMTFARLGQRLHLGAIEQIRLDAFDVPLAELFAQARFAEARDADHALVRRGALRQPRQRRPDLAADAEDDEVAGQRGEFLREDGGRRGHHVFEMIDVAKMRRQRYKVGQAACLSDWRPRRPGL